MTVGLPHLVRMSIANFDTGEEKECHSNPAELEEALSVLWSKKHPVGRSSAHLHYKGTDNRDYTLTLYFDADKVYTGEGGGADPAAIMDWRRYLMSFCYPVQRADGSLDEPPDMVLIWPGFMSWRAKVDNVTFRYTRWVGGGEINIFTAALRLISIGDVLITSAEARAEGAELVEFVFG